MDSFVHFSKNVVANNGWLSSYLHFWLDAIFWMLMPFWSPFIPESVVKKSRLARRHLRCHCVILVCCNCSKAIAIATSMQFGLRTDFMCVEIQTGCVLVLCQVKTWTRSITSLLCLPYEDYLDVWAGTGTITCWSISPRDQDFKVRYSLTASCFWELVFTGEFFFSFGNDTITL